MYQMPAPFMCGGTCDSRTVDGADDDHAVHRPELLGGARAGARLHEGHLQIYIHSLHEYTS